MRISKRNHDEEEEAWGASKNKCKIIIITRYMVSEVLQCSDSNSQIHNHKAFSLGFYLSMLRRRLASTLLHPVFDFRNTMSFLFSKYMREKRAVSLSLMKDKVVISKFCQNQLW